MAELDVLGLLHDGDQVEAGLVRRPVEAKRGDQAMVDETIARKPGRKAASSPKWG